MDLGKIIDIIKGFLDFLCSLFNVCVLIYQLKDIHNKHKKKTKKPKSKRKGR